MKRENIDQSVNCERRETVAWVTIDQAMTPAMAPARIGELADLFTGLQRDAQMRVVVFTLGREDSAGAAELLELTPDQALDYALAGRRLIELIEGLGKPVIAAVDGQLVGGELELALACTWRIATDRAEFSLPETIHGRLPGFGGLTRLPRLIGKSHALDLILTGKLIDAPEALRIGLIDRMTSDPGELNSQCVELSRQISANAPLAVKYALEAVNHGSEVSLAEGLRFESALFGLCFATDDVKEGTQAFLEKRRPVFQGK